MDNETLRDAMKLAVESAKESLETVRGMVPGKKEQPRLSAKRQLDYFFAMTGEDFNALRLRVGDDEFNQYFQKMQGLAENA